MMTPRGVVWTHWMFDDTLLVGQAQQHETVRLVTPPFASALYD
jgi:hypothetical protein